MKNLTANLFLTGTILIAGVSAARIPEAHLRSKRYLGSGMSADNFRVNVSPPLLPSPVNYGGSGGSGTNADNFRVNVSPPQETSPVNNGGNGGSGTNTDNFRVNASPPQQPSPVNYGGNGGSGSVHAPQYPSQGNKNGDSQNSNGGGSFQQSVDTNNNGGTHENNVGIGGIQNFAGARGEAQIQKILADANNNGGSHQTNAGIGGLLVF